MRELISDELDYELEAQHQRRLERRFRGHPDILVARAHTGLSSRRVLVTDYVEGLTGQEISQLPEAERDRVGELVFRFYFGLAWRDALVAGDPHADNCLLCADGRVCLLDFGLLRDVDPDHVEGERGVMRAIADGDAQGVHHGLSRLSYLPDPDAVDPDALLEHLATAGGWLLAPGLRRLGPADVDRTVELGYPPRSPWFAQMRRLSLRCPRCCCAAWSSRSSPSSATCARAPTGARWRPSTMPPRPCRRTSAARIATSSRAADAERRRDLHVSTDSIA